MNKLFGSISSKVFAGYAAVFVITAIAAVMLINTTSSVSSRVSMFVEKTIPELEYLELTASTVKEQELSAYSLYGTTTSVAQFEQKRSELDRLMMGNLEKLQETGYREVGGLERDLGSISRSLDQVHNIMSASDIDWNSARSELMVLTDLSAAALQRLERVKRAVSEDAAQSSEQILQNMNETIQMVAVLVTIIGLVAAAGFIFARRQVAKPITLLANELIEVADSHDLSVQIPVQSNDEIGRAAHSVNDLLSVFRAGMSSVMDAIDSIGQSVNALGDAACASDDTVNHLNNEIDRLVSLMTQLEAQIDSGAGYSYSASESAQQGAEEVEAGARAVAKTAESIEALAGDIETTASSLLALRNAGDQVAGVVGTIADIADQTNLLALNAAIEAARAGETGRGFAVVADEVRTLANRTRQSTIEINSMLESIVISITTSVDTMASNQDKARESVELAQNTVTSLSAIRQTISDLSQACDQAARLATDSRTEVSSVREQVASFKELGGTVAHGVGKTQQVSGALDGSARQLQDLVARFKV
ncbi:methyl-accepting chemotaxis protein [Marinobacterium jannaschii]|uniref:methyl-accepting chemotaxis protein n=1 Tax=Marinobacterium jannaschii TaxID=64970 RepID=UPI000683E7A7|nr:methyl-accepting chemotaxis protein [Marinobacterium jannaschii]